jgi:hypothetical protein
MLLIYNAHWLFVVNYRYLCKIMLHFCFCRCIKVTGCLTLTNIEGFSDLCKSLGENLKMNKKLIALAVAGVISGYGAAANASTTVSGFVDVGYVLADETYDDSSDATTLGASPAAKNSKDGTFSSKGEVDVISTMGAVTARIDIDVDVDPSPGSDSATLEQAHIAWDLDSVTLFGGSFNNPLGADGQDKPDMEFNSHSVVYNIMDDQTTLNDGNNVSGVAVAGAIGPVTLTGAYLNDIGGADEENSMALIANMSPMPDLDIELGMLTQDDQASLTAGTDGDGNALAAGYANTAGDVIDFNVTYGIAGATVGLDYMTASNIIDSAYTVWGGYNIGKFDAKVRLESVSFESNTAFTGAAPKDHEVITFYGSYKAAENLKIGLEIRDAETGAVKGTSSGLFRNDAITGVGEGMTTTLKMTATF